MEKIEPLALSGILLLLAAALWLGSHHSQAEIAPFLKRTLPQATRIEKIKPGFFAAWQDKPAPQLLGYLTVGTSQGYGGDLQIIVALSPAGKIMATTFLQQQETPSFFQRVLKSGTLQSLVGKKFSDGFLPGKDMAAVSGATLSTRAIADAVRRGSQSIAREILDLNVPGETRQPIRFSQQEYIIMALLALAILAGWKRFPYPRLLRWLTLLFSLIGLGFLVNRPLSLIFFNKLLLGIWPAPATNLYGYILLAGLLFFFLVLGSNPYCERICPFGAAQECIAAIGGATIRLPLPLLKIFRWLQRLIALTLIVAALLLRNPSAANFEISAVLFSLFGATWQFMLLGTILIGGLFLKRPWCLCLCPVKPVLEYLQKVGYWARRLAGRYKNNP